MKKIILNGLFIVNTLIILFVISIFIYLNYIDFSMLNNNPGYLNLFDVISSSFLNNLGKAIFIHLLVYLVIFFFKYKFKKRYLFLYILLSFLLSFIIYFGLMSGFFFNNHDCSSFSA